MTTAPHFVADIMTRDPVVTGPAVTAWTADQLAQERSVHDLVVVDGYRLVGVVCRCDLRRAGVAAAVASCMHRDPATVDDQETAEVAAERMIAMRVGCLPVVDCSGTLRGVVTRRDLRRIGLIHAKDIRRCASCGSTHGLEECDEGAPVSFCSLCTEQGREPRSIADEAYFTLGGGD